MIKGYGSHSYYLMGVCQKLYEKQAFKYTCNYQSFKFFNTSVRYSQTRFTDAISKRSLLVWMSRISGPREVQSRFSIRS